MNYNKEYIKYLTSAILDNANNKITSTALMTAFAIYLGISDFWIGILVYDFIKKRRQRKV